MTSPADANPAKHQPATPDRADRGAKRRWFRFSLKTLLLAMLLGVVLLGAWRWYSEPFRAQQQAIAAIREAGGSVTTEPDESAWLHALVGAELPEKAIHVSLGNSDLTQQLFEHLLKLGSTKTLFLGGGEVTDERVARLVELVELRELLLDSTAATDATVAALRDANPELSVYRSERRLIQHLGNQPEHGIFVQDELSAEPYFTISSNMTQAIYAKTHPVDFSGSRLATEITGDPQHQNLTDLVFSCNVQIDGQNVDDNILSHLHLGAVPSLRRLAIHCPGVADAGLAFLADLRDLTLLDVSGTSLSDEGMSALAGLDKLVQFEAKFTQISEAGIEHLPNPKTLVVVDVSWTKVRSLGFLSAMPALEALDASNCQLTNDDLQSLGHLQRLTRLSLNDNDITDAGLPHLKHLQSLQELYIMGAFITDVGLAHLHSFKRLQRAYLSGSISPSASQQLKDEIPTLKTVWFDQSFKGVEAWAKARTPRRQEGKREFLVVHPVTKRPRRLDSDILRFEKDGKFGFKTRGGEIVIPARFEGLGETFKLDWAPAKLGGKWGYIDRKGQFVIEPRFDAAVTFHEGLATVMIDDSVTKKWGFIDRKGKMVIPASYTVTSNFFEGLALVRDGRYGFIDMAGRKVIPCIYEEAGIFRNGIAVVRDGGYGVIDATGRRVIPCVYDRFGIFRDGLAGVGMGDRGGFVDEAGRIVIEPKFDRIGALIDGRARVMRAGPLYRSVVDVTGKLLYPYHGLSQ